MAIDLDALWDFQNPQLSEQRFRQALDGASSEEAQILQTQIARTYSLRGDFETARTLLQTLQNRLTDTSANPEAEVRLHMEQGRTYASGAHDPAAVSNADRNRARGLYLQAAEVAKAHQLDGLAIDALHMMAFVDTEPSDQLRWGQQALAIAQASDQSQAKQWIPSLLNNTGYALHRLGRYQEALSAFQDAVALREQGTNAWATHVAHWMVAWTLRALGRTDEALDLQLRLEREREVAGQPDASVFEELEILYRSKNDTAKANDYAEKIASINAANSN